MLILHLFNLFLTQREVHILHLGRNKILWLFSIQLTEIVAAWSIWVFNYRIVLIFLGYLWARLFDVYLILIIILLRCIWLSLWIDLVLCHWLFLLLFWRWFLVFLWIVLILFLFLFKKIKCWWDVFLVGVDYLLNFFGLLISQDGFFLSYFLVFFDDILTRWFFLFGFIFVAFCFFLDNWLSFRTLHLFGNQLWFEKVF